ncbi:DUF5715 family protein [Terriglobus sp. RCC_193]|uniref:DUF5715 family protein n=1 Tax=Terriglobus sp. RCC_193 TaxID=3239218 RepID=UPI003523A7CF
MYDSPRPANGMPATPNGTVSRSLSVRTVALALAATLLPTLSHAATRHTAAHPAAKHGKAAPAHTTAAKSAKSHRNTELERAEAASRKPAKGHAAKRVTAAKPEVAIKRPAGREAIEAARAEVRGAHAAAQTKSAAVAEAPSRKAGAPAEAATVDRATQDRVHAWYKSHTTASSDETADIAAPAKPATAKAKPVKQVVAPDLSPTPRKATVEDFDRALEQQRQALRTAQAQNLARTTDDDDAAEAATQIPRTAPTARVALPFVHGDLLAQAASDQDTAVPDVAPPERVRTNTVDTASVDTTKANLPKPIVIRKDAASAVAAVKTAARKPELDPQTTQALTDATFDDDGDAPTDNTRTVKAAPVVRRAVAASDEDAADAAVIPAVKVDLYDTRGRIKMLPAMKGSHEILVHQNQMAVADGLDRIEDDDQLQQMRHYKLLVSLPNNESIMVNDTMPANRRYARPWTVRFLNDLARAHYARFHTPLVITSAVRTVEFQKHLVRINGNAAPPTGDVASPHLYGQAIDLGKRGMSMTEIAWMRAYLTPVEVAGKVDVEEEFQQACFHISVYRRYLGLPQKKNAPTPDALPQRRMELVKAVPAPSRRRRHISALLAAGVR